jgi:sugar phosphate isomerase/epimerase
MMPRPPLSSTTVCYPLSVAPGFTLERALQGFASAGLQLAEIVAIPGYCEHLMPNRMGDGEIEEVRELLKKYSLSPVVINVAADLTTSEGVAFMGEAMRVARALGVNTIVAGIEQTETANGEARFRKLLPSIISLADRYDVVVALETHGGLVTTGVQGIQLLKEIGSERLKLTYDMANIVYHAGILPNDDLLQMGQDIGRYVAHVHLKDKANMKTRDYDFPPFGMGILDFKSVLELLYEGGYRGVMTLEVELDGQPPSPEIVDSALIQSYDYLYQFWTKSSTANATEALQTNLNVH